MIRAAAVTDLPLIYRGELAYMRAEEPGSLEGWTNATDRNLALWIDNLDRAFVVEVDGAPAGYAIWTPDADAALLVTINVLPQFRRRGLAGALLDRYAEDARAHGATRLTLGVHRGNPAQRLYEDRGFIHTAQDGDYLLFARELPG